MYKGILQIQEKEIHSLNMVSPNSQKADPSIGMTALPADIVRGPGEPAGGPPLVPGQVSARRWSLTHCLFCEASLQIYIV